MPTPVPLPLSEARRDVLYAVRRRGEATVEDVAAALGMTPSGARQHLLALADAGLVVGRPQPGPGRGRPAVRYRVTDAAESVFPRAYGELTNELLGYLDEATEAFVFERRRDQRVAGALVELGGLDGRARVDGLARILDRDGYLATVEDEPDGALSVVERNCAIAAVAAAHPCACRSELEFLRAVLPGCTVDRVDHMAAGAPQCRYVVRPATR